MAGPTLTTVRLAKCAERINAKYDNYTLLDVGCRTRDLEPLLKGCKAYYGTDLTPYEGVLQCDLEKELPFEDGAFDIITAMDVLEHLDKPHRALDELFRVAKKAVFISLPNMFYIQFRWNFLIGKGISGKYTFHKHPVIDRHRWILSYQESIDFIEANANGRTVDHEMVLPTRGRTKRIAEPTQECLANIWPNLFAYGVLFEITL
ncbi:class I SAM-dependent methyltransferase [Nitratidesulfovibrio vulgaris]|uniref:class I SAM-dependent methyltransferase n=1 Tax=Nitratidesulfovibrio vulgaris TaxID=881 RepID=UPI002301D1CE|nr:class I SAM-dependent methyltransferase [Nitratidesulfovibrio vulgaris]WCB45553.1 class I SAM-dependent methyltransferase [Nitratidesulfovibrio vulgaris]